MGDFTMPDKFIDIINFIKKLYKNSEKIPLHEPCFIGNEKKYLCDCIDSTFVSYIGKYVTLFEEAIKKFTGTKYAVAVSSGTVALHIALIVAGVKPGDEILTQPLTFVATANAISHAGAVPFFIDCERSTLGMSPEKLRDFLKKEVELRRDGYSYNIRTGARIFACVPVHVFGHPVRIDDILKLCEPYNIIVIEDAAESLGSYYKEKHTGTFGKVGILSFNGNKIVTTGGGGMIITDDENVAYKARHLTTTAKVPHKWEFIHDEIGYNYRMPNVNAAIGVAQMEKITEFLENKRETAKKYEEFCKEHEILFVSEPEGARSNYWLNAIILKDREERDAFLEYSNS
ncbi:MAG: LegC family aminotransferase, partial [Candidatus Goldbacteria bacterium]|nr:LegC family aminotransferase [Candidatus Goldiibacteriota bacterium]